MTIDVLVLPKGVQEGVVTSSDDGTAVERGLLLTLDVAWRGDGEFGVFATTIPIDLGLAWPQNLANGRTAVEGIVRAQATKSVTGFRFQMV
jgi:hypothetical protein